MKYENCSKRCVIDYFQYYEKSYEDVELQYISCYTPERKFHFYYYTNHFMYPKNLVHIYSQEEMKRNGIASPLITLKNFHIDFNNIKDFEEKLSIWSVFV